MPVFKYHSRIAHIYCPHFLKKRAEVFFLNFCLPLTWNSPLLATGMVPGIGRFLMIGETK